MGIAIYFLGLFAPLPLLTLTWLRLRSCAKSKYITVIAILASGSYAYLMAALISKRVLLGADYSSRLFTTVAVNTFATLALSVLAFFRKSPIRPLLVFSSLTTSFAWFLVWAINTIV
jgi:hypothetical protein